MTASWRASPAGDQLEALFGSFGIGWRGYGIVLVIAFIRLGADGVRLPPDGETIS